MDIFKQNQMPQLVRIFFFSLWKQNTFPFVYLQSDSIDL